MIFKSITRSKKGRGWNKKQDSVFVADSAIGDEHGFAYNQNSQMLPQEFSDAAYYSYSMSFLS